MEDSTDTGKVSVSALASKVLSIITDSIYPVGSIYMSVDSTSPATLFGGTWEQLKDRFLLGAGDTYTAGNTGGEATHTLTVNEIPSHTHTANTYTGGTVTQPDYVDGVAINWVSAYRTSIGTINNTGGGLAHNNMPPYLVVYVWKRTA